MAETPKKSTDFSIQNVLSAAFHRAASAIKMLMYGAAGSNFIALRVKDTGGATSGYVLTSAAGGGGGVTMVSARIVSTHLNAASGMYVRFGAGQQVSAIFVASHKVSAIQVANHKVSAIMLANAKVSAIQLANHKVSAIQLANAKTSAIYVQSHIVTGVPRNLLLSVSAAFNAAGSAQLIAASAGFTRKITDLMITSYADDIKVSVKGGGRKATPWMHFKKGGGQSHPFSIRPMAIQGSAVKLSASAGSGQVLLHYYV